MITQIINVQNNRMLKAVNFIEENCDRQLNLEEICKHIGSSKYHFHRQFFAYYGINVFEFIQIAKLKLSANSLAFEKNKAIIEISFDTGFDSQQSFSKAFKRIFGQSPSAFRKNPDWAGLDAATQKLKNARRKANKMEKKNYEVEIVDFSTQKIVSVTHKGPVSKIGDTIEKLIAFRKENNLPPTKSATFNIFHSPYSEKDKEYSVEIGVAYEGDIAANVFGMNNSKIEGGRCAKLIFIGLQENFEAAANYLYSDWLPNSGEKLRDYPLFCERKSFFPFVKANEEETHIYLPLE